MTDDEEMASTRLSLQLGRVGVHQSPSCSSSSSAGRPSAAPGGSGAAAHHGPRPRHMLTEVMTSLPPPPPATNSACRLLLISCMGRRRSYLGAPIDWLIDSNNNFRRRRRRSGCGVCSPTGSRRGRPSSAVRWCHELMMPISICMILLQNSQFSVASWYTRILEDWFHARTSDVITK